MTTVYTTDLDGKVSVVPVGSEAATVTAIATNASAEHSALAGFTQHLVHRLMQQLQLVTAQQLLQLHLQLQL
jgi:hypothetical protein